MKILRFLVLAFLLFFGIQLRAQTDTILKLNSTVYSVKTSDGNTIVGMILDYDESTIVVKSSSLGAVTIQRASIISITELNGHVVKVEKIWHENPGATRYFIGSSAIPMKRGHGYYQNIMLFLQAGEYGITNHISIKVGTELFNLASDRDPPSFYCVAPRIGFQVYPRIYVGGGVVYTNFPSYTNWGSDHRLMSVAMATFGNMDNNFTVNVGWSIERSRYYSPTYPEPGIAFAKYPTLGFSGMVRAGKWFGLVTENWYYNSPGAHYSWADLYYSVGMRAIGRNFTADVGIMGSTDGRWSITRIGSPYATFTLHFPQTKD